MRLGLIGLGRMGANMARRLRRHGHELVVFDVRAATRNELANEIGAVAAGDLEDLVRKLEPPRIVWAMLPAGQVTENTFSALSALLTAGDTLIDGANSFYKDSMRRGAQAAEAGMHFLDVGVSGGVWGLENGYALMVGGPGEAVDHVKPILQALAPAPDKGLVHCGATGSGHFAKMIHNGIEYGMMQAYAEGFALMKAREDFDLDLVAIAESWRHGSVVRSWLLDLTAEFLAKDQQLNDIEPFVADSGEGRWTALEAVEQGIPAPVMSLALMMRFATQGHNDYSAKLLAMMRKGFGGHTTKAAS